MRSASDSEDFLSLNSLNRGNFGACLSGIGQVGLDPIVFRLWEIPFTVASPAGFENGRSLFLQNLLPEEFKLYCVGE